MHFVATILALLAGADAHMLLTKPQMFPNTGMTTLNNGPLSGADYPCRASTANAFDFSFDRTKLTPGENFTMSMMGSAVHGGGSCQVSLTKDLKPTKDSVWKVIHSIEGGCPARNTPGNLSPSSAKNPDPFTYSFTIPKDLEAGQYTYSWSWLNKIGNREFYMNCAPVEIGGSSSKRGEMEARASSYFDSLPNMFIANIPESDCTTADSQDMKFPDPGDSLERNNPSDKLADPVLKSGGSMDKCYSGFKGAGGSGSSAPSSGSKSGPISGSGSGSGSGSSSDSSSGSSSPASAPSSTPVAAPSPVAPMVPPSVAAPASSAVAPSTAPASGSGSCPSGQQPCTSPGSLVCVGSTQFGICNINNCLIPQAVAQGTHCTGNAIAARAVPPQGRRGVLGA